MTHDLILSTVRDDDGEVAVWLPAEGAAVLYLTPERARALTDTTRELLRQSIVNLTELREGSAHIALGYEHWHEYVEAEFGSLRDYRMPIDERRALVASMTVAGYTVREQRDALGYSLGTIHGDQRTLGLVPDRPLPKVVDDEPEPLDPFRGLSPKWSALARVEAQGSRGLTSLELDAELDAALGTATGSLSKLAARGLIVLGELGEARANRRPYRITPAGRARLVEVLAARDAAEVR
jgi:hypothetical protein